MGNKLGYAVLEVGGIQNFILGTGKLKEMIGGSELIESLSKNFLEEICKQLNLKIIGYEDPHEPKDNEVLTVQRNAGALHLLFSSSDKAKSFVNKFGLAVIEKYPGLPLFAAVETCEWKIDSLLDVKHILSRKITEKRNLAPVATGLEMLPICTTARLDGLPAVEIDKKVAISLVSRTRRTEDLLRDAKDRLNETTKNLPSELRVICSDDLNELAGDSNRVAFIHMDGNDLGNLFAQHIKENKSTPVEQFIYKMGKLSKHVEETTKAAFDKALLTIIDFEAKYRHKKKIICPARPLVLGGDDVTVIVRADLALLFIDAFVKEFEAYSQKQERLSVGVGMVVCQSGYPFLKAFSLAEDLLKNAKQATANITENRPSSLDYIVLTNDAENNLNQLRNHIKATDGSSLTSKPIMLKDNNLLDFMYNGLDVLLYLPRSAVRTALNECRKGKDHTKKIYEQIIKNIQRDIGGRNCTSLLKQEDFLKIFPKGFFIQQKDGKYFTALSDYLELDHMLSAPLNEYIEYFKKDKEGSDNAN